MSFGRGFRANLEVVIFETTRIRYLDFLFGGQLLLIIRIVSNNLHTMFNCCYNHHGELLYSFPFFISSIANKYKFATDVGKGID